MHTQGVREMRGKEGGEEGGKCIDGLRMEKDIRKESKEGRKAER